MSDQARAQAEERLATAILKAVYGKWHVIAHPSGIEASRKAAKLAAEEIVKAVRYRDAQWQGQYQYATPLVAPPPWHLVCAEVDAAEEGK
jgi:hypothetical protein